LVILCSYCNSIFLREECIPAVVFISILRRSVAHASLRKTNDARDVHRMVFKPDIVLRA
ncbi:hypothetical protein X975_00517, partial [Stegodyphus mimosarum]